MVIRRKGIVKLKDVKFLKAAQKEAKREGLTKTASALGNIRFQIKSEARKGSIPKFKKPLIDAPGQFISLPKRVRKQIKVVEI